MKAPGRLLLFTLGVVIWIAPSVFAHQESNEVRNRSIGRQYKNKEADGMKVWFYKVQGAKFIPANEEMPFKTGDQLKVEFESNFDGYIYFINVDPEGKATIMYPRASSQEANKVLADQKYV